MKGIELKINDLIYAASIADHKSLSILLTQHNGTFSLNFGGVIKASCQKSKEWCDSVLKEGDKISCTIKDIVIESATINRPTSYNMIEEEEKQNRYLMNRYLKLKSILINRGVLS